MSATPSMTCSLVRTCGVVHDLFNGLAFAGAFQRRGGDVGHRLGIVELEPLLEPALGNEAHGKQQEFVLLFGSEVHIGPPFVVNTSKRADSSEPLGRIADGPARIN